MRSFIMRHKKKIGFLMTIAMVAILALGYNHRTLTKTYAASTNSTNYRCIGYYASWAGYARNYGIDKVDYSKLTHLNFAFANLQQDGTVVVGDPWIDCQITSLYPNAGFNWEDQSNNRAGHFGMLAKIKEQYPHLKTLISIGGWTWSRNFSDVAADSTKLDRMATTAVEFILKYGFDGIDIDWEYPVEGGDNITHRPGDKANYVEMVRRIRAKLNAQSAIDGKTYLLTIAAPASQYYANNIDIRGMMNYLDWINLMTYDYHGGFDSHTNHNSPLYLNPNDTTGSAFSIEATINAYINGGANPRDLNLGLPYYGRGWINVNATPSTALFHSGSPSTSAGLDLGTWEGSTWDYWDIKSNYIGKRGYVRYWDNYAKCPYLYSEQTKVFITYDDTESLGYKIDYMVSRNLGGVMFWECSGDKEGELLSFTANRLAINSGNLPPTPTPNTPTPTPRPTTPTPTPTPVENNITPWDRNTIYVNGDRVSYNGSIYRAKWWTLGNVPGTEQWGPWEYIGPIGAVTPTPTVTPRPTITPTVTPRPTITPTVTPRPTVTPTPTPTPTGNEITPWDRNTVYVNGDMVSYNGSIYRAKWWTLGNVPGTEQWGPWEYLGPIGGITPTPIPPTPTPITPTPTSVPGNPTPTPIPSGDLPTYVLTGYWQNFNNGAKCLKINEVPLTYDIICVAFAEATATPGEVTFRLDSTLSSMLGGYTESQFINDIAAVRSRGQKVILSVGGEVGTVSVTNETQANSFANSLYALMNKYGFDGVDIDLEHGINARYMESALRKLYNRVGSDLIITMAPQTLDMQNTGTEYFKLALAIKDILTICNTQYYNSGTMLGYDNKVYGQGNADFFTALATIQLENGLRPDQVGLGAPASNRGASSGYVDPAIVCNAFKSLVRGTSSGSFKAPRAYPTLRGIMTWSINWDASNNYNFSNTVAACFAELE